MDDPATLLLVYALTLFVMAFATVIVVNKALKP